MIHKPERLTEIAPGIRRLLAPNPSPMTHDGTNTYLIGTDPVVVVDPGPDSDIHLAAIIAAAPRVDAILITHSHHDHTALAPRLSRVTGAPIVAFGDNFAGRSVAMARLASDALGGGEGVDPTFNPDEVLADGATGPQGLHALHTPGHFGNHLAFALGDVILTGDLVMGWASTLISPPDGDLTAFYDSCAKLRARPARLLLPGHGPVVGDPTARIDTLVAHRRTREAQIQSAIADGHKTAQTITTAVYTDVAPALFPAAVRNVLAHLIDLEARNLITFAEAIGPDAAIGPPQK